MKKHSQFKEGINQYKNIDFFLIKKNKKSWSIKLNSKSDIIVSIPFYISDEVVIDFLDKHLKKMYDISKNIKNKYWFNLDENYFYLFGEKIYFNISENQRKIIINNRELLTIYRNDIENSINLYRKKRLMEYLILRQKEFEDLINVEKHQIKIKNKSSAWATNYIFSKTINYSINLASFSKEIIDYVIIHELSHHNYHNHSKDFWNFVCKYDENFKLKRYKLKNYIYY